MPIGGCYRVRDQLLAGEHPSGRDAWRLKARLGRLLKAGATFFLDLTEVGEKGLRPYAPLLYQAAAEVGRAIAYRRMPIPDFETPTVDRMGDILDVLDAALADGHTAYVHCYAGIGRTGTVIGCYLVRHGRSGQEALDELVDLRRGTALAGTLSPVTDEQRQLVHEWADLDKGR